MSDKRLRSGDVLVRIGEGTDHEIVLKKTDPLDMSGAQLLPDMRHVLSRYFTIAQEVPVRQQQRDKTIRQALASELWYDWIYLNLPPVNVKNIDIKLEKLVKSVTSLRDNPVAKRGATWIQKMKQLNLDINNGWDIRSYHATSISILEEQYEVLIGEEEEKLYQDNCVPVDGKCPRKMVVGGTDQVWLKEAQERIDKLEESEKFAERKEDRKKKVAEKLKKIREDAAASVVSEVNPEVIDNNEVEMFKKPRSVLESKVVPSMRGVTRPTKSSSASTSLTEETSSDSSSFPTRVCRTGLKNVDPSIVEVMVVMESKYKVEQRQVAPLLAYIMNTLAGQHWEAPIEESEMPGTDTENINTRRGRKPTRDLTYVLPSRKSLRSKLQDASLLSFRYVAEAVQAAQVAGGTVTLGVDDTIKASGFHVHDVKTGRVTIVESREHVDGDDTEKSRTTFSTGFLPNISHTGKHSAMSVKTWMSQMAVLCDVQY